jgi:glycosyltransferase involved in cell wall biosynthesis
MSGFADQVTPVVLTGNEEPNIERTLRRLAWAGQVIVCDSFSSDRTVEIARSFANVRVVQRSVDTLAGQWTFALTEVRTAWALTLDADYFVPEAFEREIASLQPVADVAAYEASFIYAVNGRPLRASLYPPRSVLLRTGRFRIYMDGHTQRVQVDGLVEHLRSPIVHDDRKDLHRFIDRQRKYMRQEAAKLRGADPRTLNLAARIRKLRVVAPLVVIPYTLFVKRLILDGTAGLRYTFERFLAELILSRELFRRS